MRALRDAVGGEIELMVDINQGWDVNRSIAMGREMEQCGLYWLEDPVNHEDFEGLARIADALDDGDLDALRALMQTSRSWRRTP